MTIVIRFNLVGQFYLSRIVLFYLVLYDLWFDRCIGFFLGFHATFPREIDYVFD